MPQKLRKIILRELFFVSNNFVSEGSCCTFVVLRQKSALMPHHAEEHCTEEMAMHICIVRGAAPLSLHADSLQDTEPPFLSAGH